MFSGDVEISAPVFIKARGLRAYVEQADNMSGHFAYLPESNLFSDRCFSDPSLPTVSFATAPTVNGIWQGAELIDHGPTTAPDDDKEGTDYRLYETTARIAETIYIKAETGHAAIDIFRELLGQTFEFEETEERFFTYPPLNNKNVGRITFRTDFVVHRPLEPLEDRGSCPG